MKEKRWMVQYFHDRTYRPQSLQEFEKEVKKAAIMLAHMRDAENIYESDNR